MRISRFTSRVTACLGTAALAVSLTLAGAAPAAATGSGTLCVPDVSASANLSYTVSPRLAFNQVTVTYNGCGRAVRAFLHCDYFPFGTQWHFGSSTYAVGSKSSTQCGNDIVMSYGYEYKDGSGQWVRVTS
ncbi:hypothetical protein QEZ54_14680 [Catellatospora sp. KI3]|uniref:hypothetical protein n=1 Tax=Catellatospora sp. KI3 TaxID=3041620 RepID=UPI002482DFA8|nr:hypothetical protein [Catellatospora sp. KI3]MDI1462212.1 hypothetical protein [Catellatospora sp. KI3]